MPQSLFRDVAYPLAANCNNSASYLFTESDKYLNDFFYEYSFEIPLEHQASNWFEHPKIHKAGSYTPAYYQFDDFWIVFSIYRKQYGNNFIPHYIKDKEGQDGHKKISRLKEKLESYDRQDIRRLSGITGLNGEDIEFTMEAYIQHLDKLVRESGR